MNGYADFDLTLPCGLRISVQQLGQHGAGEDHAHAYEHVWCVETPAKVFGRGYESEQKVALGRALTSAKQVLVESRTVLEHVAL